MQQESITMSGVTIRHDDAIHDSEQIASVIELLGGLAATIEYDERVETALQIIDQNTVGTTLTTENGVEWVLTSKGWYNPEDETISTPNPENVVSATMPGGWAWSL